MHPLGALIWKSYKLRTRSYYLTILDLFGPLLVISLYVGIKLVLNYTHELQMDDGMGQMSYFRNNTTKGQINLKQDIRLRMCHRVLYHSSVNDDNNLFSTYLTNECGLQLDRVSSRDELVERLKSSLDSRVSHRPGVITDLNKPNATNTNNGVDNCIKLPSSSNNSSSNSSKTATIYQMGLERTSSNSFEIHMTDSAGSSVINMPYSQGSSYNEYKLPSSDLNVGYYLIEICLINAASKQTIRPVPSPNQTTTTTAAATTSSESKATTTTIRSTTRQPYFGDGNFAPGGDEMNHEYVRGHYLLSSSSSSPPPPAYVINLSTNNTPTRLKDIKWLIKPYPTITGVYLLPVGTTIIILLAFLCTNIATIVRVSEANENGLHRYTRLSGVPSGLYWLGEFIVSVASNLVQSLIMAIILGIGSGGYPYDPIAESAMTLKWMLLFTYSLNATTISIFLGSLFDRTLRSVLALCFLASVSAMYPLLLILQWTPYGFTQMRPIAWLSLLSPAPNMEAICLVLIGVALQTNEPFGWSHLSESIVNGGFSDMTVGELWALMVVQIIVWLLLTIMVDQYYYSTASNYYHFIVAQFNELFCCNSCGDKDDRTSVKTRTKTIQSGMKSALSRRDPNRICCSLRNIQVSGVNKLVPFTKGNPLRLSREQVHTLRRADVSDASLSKTAQYLVNRKLSATNYIMNPQQTKDQPIFLDEAIKQNIVWYDTQTKFANLNLDFRFNQVTFVLGQTDLKELLFETLLGLSTLDGGHVIIDNVKYSPATMGLARRQIGYLSDKDVFYQELSIFENLQLFGTLRDPSYKSYDSESLYVLSLLHLSHRRDDYPSSLTHRSGRKLALAVALVGYTKLLLLTEPTLNLRWRPRCQVYNLLRKYKSIRSIVVDTSDVDEAVAFGDRLVLLRNGSTDLNDEPKRLNKQLGCGYWLVFEPTVGDGRSINSSAIQAMEKLTNELFKQDKLDLNATKRSIYQDLDHIGATVASSKEDTTEIGAKKSAKSPVNVMKSPKNNRKNLAASVTRATDELQRLILVVKIQHTTQSERGLCSIMKMFAKNHINGFRLVQVNYESLEDILVLRMSRAVYPDLPPDLLLSLQHRTTQSYHKTRSTYAMPISVRRLSSSNLPAQQSTKTTSIFDTGIMTIIKDRFGERSEIILLFVALFSSLVIIAITLLSLRYSLKSDGTKLKDSAHSSSRSATAASIIRHSSLGTSSSSSSSAAAADDYLILQHTMIDRLYKYRIGFYVLERGPGIKTINGNSSNTNTPEQHPLLQSWQGNKNLLGVVDLSTDNRSDSEIVASLVDKSKDVAGSLIVYDPRSSETIVIFEPHLPHILLASIRAFLNFELNLDSANQSRLQHHNYQHRKQPEQQTVSPLSSSSPLSSGAEEREYTLQRLTDNDDENPLHIKTSRHNFYQPWHEMIQGFPSRRLIYGLGFAIAEAISIGVLVMAPIRHRNMSRSARVPAGYWIKMAIVDLGISFVNILGYLVLFVAIEGVTSMNLFLVILLVSFIYKLTSLPIPYLTSFVAESCLYGFLFIFILYLTIVWDLAIFIRSYIDWTLISNSIAYTITNWIIFGMPISGLIESLVVINQVNNIQARCKDVPAFVPTSNSVELEGIHRQTTLDSLLEKVRECLANGKTSVTTNVLHGQNLGILWSIYLMLLFGVIFWAFLLTCERLFGLFARRTSNTRASSDPMKTVIRLPDPSSSPSSRKYAWDKERDRLISEYVRCINENKYVKTMARHCLILRVWLRPFDIQATKDKQMSKIIEPLINLGYSKDDIQIEIRTTLQLFIRLGDESKQCRVDKITLIETYSKYAAAHSDTIAKFAVVDWTRENLYKILLHGYYNNKTVS